MVEAFDDKVALVTGAASGIGRATAITFAGAGASVVVSDVDSEGGEETVGSIKEAGGEATFIYADVSKASHVEELVSKTVEIYGRLDAAHNNAGVEGVRVPMAEFPEDEWDRVINVDLKGVWLCMKYEIPQMLSQGGGSIVNTSSDAGLIGWSGSAVYTASKWGVIGLTKSAALQYIAEGVRINAVCPGFIRTPMTDSSDPRAEERMIAATPAGRIGTVDEVVGAVLWLCSDEASFVVGHPLSMDGGTTSGMW